MNPPTYTPVQLLAEESASYLFFVQMGQLRCSRYNSPTPSQSTYDFTMPVYKERFVGFTAHKDGAGYIYCFIQKVEGGFVTLVSQDSAMTWQPERL